MTTFPSSSLLSRISNISLPPRVEGDIYGDIEFNTYAIQFSSAYENEQLLLPSSSSLGGQTNPQPPILPHQNYRIKIRWWGQNTNQSSSTSSLDSVEVPSIHSNDPISVYVNTANQYCTTPLPITEQQETNPFTTKIYYPLCTDIPNMATYFRDMSHLLLEIYSPLSSSSSSSSSSSVCIGTGTILLKDTLGNQQFNLSGVVPIIQNNQSSNNNNNTNNSLRIGSLVYSLVLRYGKDSIILQHYPDIVKTLPPPDTTEQITNLSTIPDDIPFTAWESYVTSLKLRSEAISKDRERDIEQGIIVHDRRKEVPLPPRPAIITVGPPASMVLPPTTVDMNVSYPMAVALDPNAASTVS